MNWNQTSTEAFIGGCVGGVIGALIGSCGGVLTVIIVRYRFGFLFDEFTMTLANGAFLGALLGAFFISIFGSREGVRRAVELGVLIVAISLGVLVLVPLALFIGFFIIGVFISLSESERDLVVIFYEGFDVGFLMARYFGPSLALLALLISAFQGIYRLFQDS